MPIENAVSKVDFDELRADVKEIKRYFVGNGTPGIFTRLAIIETWKTQREEEIKTERAEEKEEAKTGQERAWEFAKPFVINAINAIVLIAAFLVAIHFPGVARLFGLEIAP